MDAAIRRAVAGRLAPRCWLWHRQAYSEYGRIRPRWNEQIWIDRLTKVMDRDTGRHIAVRLCGIEGLAGMNEDLCDILDLTAPMLEEETAKALRAWVVIHGITPRLALGSPARWGEQTGRVTGHDLEQGLYYYIPDDPRIRYTDPRGIPVAYETLDPASMETADADGNSLASPCECLICQRRRIRRALIAGITALCAQTGPGSFGQGGLPSLSSIARSNSARER